MTGDKDNIIFNDMDEGIGFYKDIVVLYKNLIKESVDRDDTEEANTLIEELEEINEYKDYTGLLVLSENNGMGFTCKPYKEGEQYAELVQK